jgi:protein-tyrosine phosphatase
MKRDITHLYGKLYIGGYPEPGDWRDFDLIYFVAAEMPPVRHGYLGPEVRWYPFDDSESVDLTMGRLAAESVARNLLRGRKVLVTCQMGRNRSAFVCALAIHLVTGASGARAAGLVRRLRVDRMGVRALQNRHFLARMNELPSVH